MSFHSLTWRIENHIAKQIDSSGFYFRNVWSPYDGPDDMTGSLFSIGKKQN